MAFANDGSFMEQFLAKMKDQEASGNADNSSDAGTKKSEPEPSPEPESQDFQPCSSFDGPRPGFFFKMDCHGLGYYRDLVVEQREAELEAKKKPPTVIKPRSLIAGNKLKGAVVKKTKDTKEDKEEKKSKYLSEMQKYKEMSCGSDTKHDRPLVK